MLNKREFLGKVQEICSAAEQNGVLKAAEKIGKAQFLAQQQQSVAALQQIQANIAVQNYVAKTGKQPEAPTQARKFGLGKGG